MEGMWKGGQGNNNVRHASRSDTVGVLVSYNRIDVRAAPGIASSFFFFLKKTHGSIYNLIRWGFLLRVSLSTMVRLLHYDLEVIGLKHRNSLFANGNKLCTSNPPQNLQW